MRLKVAFVALVLAISAGSCLKPDTYTCNYDACAIVAPTAEVQEIEAYLAANGITGAVKHCSGLYYRTIEPGTGNNPTVCSVVSLNYKGMLKDGTVFDQSQDPVVFQLSTLIRGWQNALPLLKEGGRMILYIPPTLGYGSGANGPIPANSMLIFEISLLGVR